MAFVGQFNLIFFCCSQWLGRFAIRTAETMTSLKVSKSITQTFDTKEAGVKWQPVFKGDLIKWNSDFKKKSVVPFARNIRFCNFDNTLQPLISA